MSDLEALRARALRMLDEYPDFADRPHDGPPWRRPWTEPNYDPLKFLAGVAATLRTVTEGDEVTRRSPFTRDSIADYKRRLTQR